MTFLLGTYCPEGVETNEVLNDLKSAKNCSANFYCPIGSVSPTSFECGNYTFSGTPLQYLLF